ncbi:MAG TPA: TonB family protein [Steroidobacteraceae bacterium]|nr:TonB family protein [Steroidobacteraceae bacterium]
MTSDMYQDGDMLRAGLPPANDRMVTTCFLAALFHAIVILGVTFSSPGSKTDRNDAPALEVILVNDQAPSVANNPNAKYLSERSQRGSGNTLKRERALIPKSSLMPIERSGIPSGDGLAAVKAGTSAGDDQLIATVEPSQKILYFASSTVAKESSQLPLLLEKRPDLAMTPNDDGVELRMRGEAMHQLWISADTQESDVAVYLDSWRRKIERVGTMNFPDVVQRQKLSGTPVIEVTIGSDGKLLQTVVRRSSGHPEIDEAAMRILKLAAPFDPFPGDLNVKHDEIRIAYEWQFLGGASQGSAVFYSEPNH